MDVVRTLSAVLIFAAVVLALIGVSGLRRSDGKFVDRKVLSFSPCFSMLTG